MLLLIAWYGLRAFVFLAGVLLVFITIQSTIHTLIVPRAINTPLINWYYAGMNKLFRARLALARQNTYELRDRVLAMYAPVSLFVLPFVWLTLMLVAYTLIFWGLGYGDAWESLLVSGSSLLTGSIRLPRATKLPIETA